MPHQVVWHKCNVFDDNGTPTVMHRGELLPDGVDKTQLEMLSVVGAVQAVEFAPEDRRPVPNDNPAPDDDDDDPEMLQKPSPEDAKPVWVDYASNERNPNRLSRTEANSMSKQALVERFKG